MRHSITCDLWVPAPIDAVWDFGSNPENLAKITPARYSAKVSAESPLSDGQRVTIQMSPYGVPLPLKWISRLSDVVTTGPKRQFVDIQESGPFHFWRHQHLFEEGAAEVEGSRSQAQIKWRAPGTWVRDRVEYELPFGGLGKLAHSFVRRDLEKLFAYRQAQFRKIFPA